MGGVERRALIRREGPPRWVGERAAPSLAPTHDGVGKPGRQRPESGRARPPRRRSRLRTPLSALPPAHPRLRARDGQGPRPRGGRDAGGLRLGAAPHARDRAAAGLQAVAVPDRQEQLHRRVPPLQARRGGLLRRRRGPRARRPLAARQLRPVARRRGRRQAGPRQPVRRVRRAVRDPPRDPRPARARGPLLPGDRPPHGHEPPGRRVDAVPRPPAPDRGVRRHRLRRALPAHPGRSS